MKAKEWKTVRETTWLCVFTDTHTNTHSFICNSACGRKKEGGRWCYAIHHSQIHIYSHTHTHTHALIQIGEWGHSLCLFVPYLISIKTIQLPPLNPSPAICNLHAKCIAWVQRWMCECVTDCVSASVGECIVNRSVSIVVCIWFAICVACILFFLCPFWPQLQFHLPCQRGGEGGASGSGIHKSTFVEYTQWIFVFLYMGWLINSAICSESGRGRQI